MIPNSNQTHPRYSPNLSQQLTESYKAKYSSNNSTDPSSTLNKNRILSLNSIKPITQSRLKGSTTQDPMQQSESGGREIKKLRMRIQELESENKSLYNSNCQFEEEVKIWQEKAKKLNDQLMRYQNMELQHCDSNTYESIRNQDLQNQEIKELKRLVIILEETNNENIKKLQLLQGQLEAHKKQNSRLIELEDSHQRLSMCCQDLQQKLQRKTIEHKQALNDLDKMQSQLEYMGNEIPNKIFFLQSQNAEINKREKQQYKDNIKQLQANLLEIQKSLRFEAQEKEKAEDMIDSLRRELQNEKDRCDKYQRSSKQQEKQIQEKLQQKLKEKEKQLISVNHELSCVAQRNHSIFQQLLSKNLEIKELTSKNRLLQDQFTALTEQFSKHSLANIQSIENSQTTVRLEREIAIYKQQIERLKRLNEQQTKKIDQKSQKIQLQRQQERRSFKQQLDKLHQHIKQMQISHQNQRFQLVQSVDSDIKEFGKMAKEQEIQIAAIHKKYCDEIDKLVQENYSLKNQIKTAEDRLFNSQRQKDRELKKSQDYSFSANLLQMEIQKLELRLKEEKSITDELHERLLISEQKYEQASLTANELTVKVRNYRMQIEQLNQQNEKWRSYRKSEEQDARKQCRRYKKRVEQLEMKQNTNQNSQQQLQIMRKTCDSLKIALSQQQKHSNILLQEQRKRFTDSIDEMESQMRKILKQCQNKIGEKQMEIEELSQQNMQNSLQLKELSERYRYSSLQFEKTITDLHQAQSENEKLKNENAMSRSEISRLQTILKKLDSDNQSLKFSSDAQKDIIRTRYDKDMEQKVTEIQRLKLEVVQLTEQLKKNVITKKQMEGIQTILRNRQMEIKESQQMNSYLEDMIQTYQGQIKTFKVLRDKEADEKKIIEENLLTLQRRTAQLEIDTEQAMRSNKINEQKYKEWKNKSQQLQFDNRRLQAKITELEIQERQANKTIKDQQMKINQLNSDLGRLSRANDERWRDQQEISNLKSMLEQSLTDKRKIQGKLYERTARENDLAASIRQKDTFISQLQKEIAAESYKSERSYDQKTKKYQLQLQVWKDKYEKENQLSRKLQAQIFQQQREKARLIRQNDSKVNQLNEINKKSSKLQSQIQDLRQKLAFLEDRIKLSGSLQQQNRKEKKNDQIQLQYKSIIEEQRSKIKDLTNDQVSKIREIQVLLSKIAVLQGQAIAKSSKPVQHTEVDRSKAQRIGWYLKMSSLKLAGISTKPSFDGNQQQFLAILYEILKVLSTILNEYMEELNVQKKIILQLSAERDNFHNKYLKYKSIATDYKERKEVQRQVLKNSYRFNQEIINHCQDILKEKK